jgi:quercetin 2,3-dioxygenase
MIALRKAADRGVSRTPWLDSRHTFSFAEYYDPKENGFSVLRVINDDRVAGGGGFPSHGHRDMEIITYVLEGALEHRDSLGTHSIIPAGDLQRMTAGKGIVHSEFNHSPSDPVHFLQIWIIPTRADLPPGYEQRTLDLNPDRGRFRLVTAPDAHEGALRINQDARLYIGSFDPGQSAAVEFGSGRRAYFQVTRGKISIGGVELGEGDGARVSAEERVNLSAAADSEVLLFDLP